MKWISALPLIVVLALAGCASAPEPGPRSETQKRWDELVASDRHHLPQKTFSSLQQALDLIRTASPDSMRKAADLLSAPELSDSLVAKELRGVGRGICLALYPEPEANPFPPDAASEIYGRLFSAAGRKSFDPPFAEETDFLSLVIPCLVLLEPEAGFNRETLGLIADTLHRADELSEKTSVIPPYLLGAAAEKSGNSSDALAFYRESSRREASFYPGMMKAADLLSATGKPAEALRILKGLAAVLPRDVNLARTTARVALECGDTQTALDASAMIMMEAPQDEEGALLRAQAFEKSGNWYQAVRVLDAWLAHSPDSAPAILMKARLLAEKGGDPEEAMRMLSEAQTRFPKNVELMELRAGILLSEGRSNEGISVLMAVLELQPERLGALRMLLDYCVRTRQWLQAKSYADRILAVSDAGRDLSAAYEVAWNLGDFSGAAGYAKKLVDKNYGESPKLLLARALHARGSDAEASPLVEAGLAEAASPGARSGYLSLRAAMALPARPADALRDLRASLLADPDNLEALRAISSLLAGQGRYHAALGYLKHAAEISPNDAGLVVEIRDIEKKAEEAPSSP